jgi:hypothetical protein
MNNTWNQFIDPGIPHERTVQTAKRTVIVLSEAYLTDHMADFENVMGQAYKNYGTYAGPANT